MHSQCHIHRELYDTTYEGINVKGDYRINSAIAPARWPPPLSAGEDPGHDLAATTSPRFFSGLPPLPASALAGPLMESATARHPRPIIIVTHENGRCAREERGGERRGGGEGMGWEGRGRGGLYKQEMLSSGPGTHENY